MTLFSSFSRFKKTLGLSLSLLVMGGIVFAKTHQSAALKKSQNPVSDSFQEDISSQAEIPSLQRKEIPQGTLYSLKVSPKSSYHLRLGLSPKLHPVDSPFWQTLAPEKPIFVINAGFFDPANQLTSSFLTQDSVRVGNPRLNPHLIENPKLKPYLPQIMNRSEFRVYQCDSSPEKFEIARHQAPIPINCVLRIAIGAGPLLLPQRTDKEEGFVDFDAQGRRVRDPIGVDAANARSAIGLTAQGDAVLMMVAQHADGRGGVNLSELSGLLKEQGVVRALALDGGSSSSLRYKDEVIWGKINSKGQAVQRPVKSVWLVLPHK